MGIFYFWSLVALIIGTLSAGMLKPYRIFEYPYFMAGIFGVFVLPQAISLLRFPGAASTDALHDVFFMACLCLGACVVGYSIPINRWLVKKVIVPVQMDRLFLAGIVFILSSSFFNYLLAGLTEEERGGTLWTGKATIYVFFTYLVYPGLSITLHRALTHRSPIAWFFTILASSVPIQATIFAGRRETTAIFLLTIMLTLFYLKRWCPPRLAVIALLLFTMLAIPSTGVYRGIAGTEDFTAVKQIDLVENFKAFLNSESTFLELRNAAMVISATAESGDYEYGTGYWDQVIFRFVPAQLLGKDFKDSLMFKDSEARQQLEISKKRYEGGVGVTTTGIGDAFQAFGYFGCLFFALLAIFFRSLWAASLLPNSIFAQLLYMQTFTSALRALTHQTVDFLPGLIYNLIFIGLAVYFSRIQPQTTRPGIRYKTLSTGDPAHSRNH